LIEEIPDVIIDEFTEEFPGMTIDELMEEIPPCP